MKTPEQEAATEIWNEIKPYFSAFDLTDEENNSVVEKISKLIEKRLKPEREATKNLVTVLCALRKECKSDSLKQIALRAKCEYENLRGVS